MGKIRLGLIGCGGMMKNHAAGISLLDNVEITAVCDVVKERAEDVATVLNSPYVTTDYTTMVDYVDAVLVVLPHHLHYQCGVFFARNKKHILMEKPLCNTEEECLKLISVCEEMKVTLMCAYPVRYWQGIVKLKELVDSGEFGKIMQMSIWTEQLTVLKETDWGASACLGGGQFFSHGCHYIDLLLWFCGNPVSGSHFGTNVGTPWLLKEGTSAVILKFENGAIGYHGATWGARGTRMGADFQIMTEKGLLEFEFESGEVRIYDGLVEHEPGKEDMEPQRCRVVWKRPNGVSKETQHEVAHFVDCVINKKKPQTDAYSALQGLRVIWKLYEAEKLGVVADLRGMGLEV
ncbi:MAG: Gfo/Idh/MocA family oxidoreductase [Oscillospiraceae bacterium]|nr:Gfo/Idh/MocA family oxidoreductase [Oscillospiraceae bacterium]